MERKTYTLKANYSKSSAVNALDGRHFPAPMAAEPVNMAAGGKTYTVYEVRDGQITIKGKQYPIKLADGFYIIRKTKTT